jgi:hypothetical protein
VTGLLPAGTLADYPPGTRILIRRERPHPGAQLDAFEERDGWRYQCLATDTAVGQLAFLDARPRPRPRRGPHPLRQGHRPGPLPVPQLRHQHRLMSAVILAVDLLAWTQTILLHDHPTLTRAEPKTLRYRLLHVAGRLVRGGRRLRLRLDQRWPWAAYLAAASTRCATPPPPAIQSR